MSSLRITTRQNIQLHWIKKKDVVNTISEIAKSGFFTINGCGDNTRNVVGCPLLNLQAFLILINGRKK